MSEPTIGNYNQNKQENPGTNADFWKKVFAEGRPKAVQTLDTTDALRALPLATLLTVIGNPKSAAGLIAKGSQAAKTVASDFANAKSALDGLPSVKNVNVIGPKSEYVYGQAFDDAMMDGRISSLRMGKSIEDANAELVENRLWARGKRPTDPEDIKQGIQKAKALSRLLKKSQGKEISEIFNKEVKGTISDAPSVDDLASQVAKSSQDSRVNNIKNKLPVDQNSVMTREDISGDITNRLSSGKPHLEELQKLIDSIPETIKTGDVSPIIGQAEETSNRLQTIRNLMMQQKPEGPNDFSRILKLSDEQLRYSNLAKDLADKLRQYKLPE